VYYSYKANKKAAYAFENHSGGMDAMIERSRLLDEINALEIRALAVGLPEETSSLLDYDMTLQQLRVFAFVFARGRMPITKVAEALGIKPNVATGIIQRLVEKGWIARSEDPTDRRVRLLEVTEQGRALVDEVGSMVLTKSRGLLDRLSDEQLQLFRDLLDTMISLQEG
jgi:DNA-binding MarR family transcriptional regulator